MLALIFSTLALVLPAPVHVAPPVWSGTIEADGRTYVVYAYERPRREGLHMRR